MNAFDDQEIIELINGLHRCMRRGFGSAAPGLSHLTLLQLQSLHYIQQRQPVAMGDLAKELRVTKASATALVSRLISTDWLVRATDQRDRRITRVALSPDGAKRLARILKRKTQMTERSLSALSPTRKRQLLGILREISHNLT